MVRRGQAWSMDLVIGVMIFLLEIGLFFVLFRTSTSKDTTELKIASEIISTKLVTSPTVGIVTDDQIDRDRVQTLFLRLEEPDGYEALKDDFGVRGEFCVYLEDDQGNLVNITNSTHTAAGLGSGSDELLLSGTPCGAITQRS